MKETREEILKRDFSEAFINKMKNAIEMSHYKYGWANKTYPELAQAYKCIAERLELYINTHTAFDVPTVRRTNGGDVEIDFETELFEGADVIMTLNCKSTGVYPGAILVLENGKPYNPFEGMNEEDV